MAFYMLVFPRTLYNTLFWSQVHLCMCHTSQHAPWYQEECQLCRLCLTKLSGSKARGGIHGKEPVIKNINSCFEMSYLTSSWENSILLLLGRIVPFIFHYCSLWLLCPWRHFTNRILWWRTQRWVGEVMQWPIASLNPGECVVKLWFL